LWLSRRGGAPGKLAKQPHPRKDQKQENKKYKSAHSKRKTPPTNGGVKKNQTQ
tara:strand:+ start:364 stop:522 length:159 start_codon:yes stop_codon:yes gene_type:complete